MAHAMNLACYLGRLLLAAHAMLRHGGVRLALALAIIVAAPAAHAEGIALKSAKVEAVEEGWQVDAEFDIQFSSRLEESVNRGVPLYFVLEFEMSRPRWYWFDEKPVRFSQTYKISYTPLLRQYRLSVGNVYQNFASFEEVTRVLSKLRGVAIADHNAIKKDSAYQARVRLRLDTAQLPKPFQLNAIASRDWSLSSDWQSWSLAP
jgi:hypothetical protein